ncbi:4-aminobutyrate aminotransferase-like enzyme/Ser/Thr protein kinase RdoA (MazF antagonist) [Rhizobium azooxidifex]|uniref:4-aminobutyrate aminotransferase-like enzyme/Ser/Thr protein kinase RdoA (MazF antagonist) n=1 Tax=Mycoplana azooxidifex TaxID=1636188 RepID=A0A7W6GLK2_9HYPH|nr:aminotransferase [Mycoplana azooxidifex]MBB3979790.1 4-aminobutyrate aminotransferase-like enzyme/Ser/Thr protein kinase RdoA (MazF antagonist) [Mycoplana azooxidifex]
MLQKGAVARADLPRPNVSVAAAEAIFRDHYGLVGDIVELGSQQDRNFRIDVGGKRYVLKICHAEYRRIELEAQNAAMQHLAASASTLLVPRAIVASSGETILSIDISGQPCQVRLLDYLDGEPLTRRKFLPAITVAALGQVCGQLAKGLVGFDHSGLDRQIQWDLQQAMPVATALLTAVPDKRVKTRIAAALEESERHIAPLRTGLRSQAIHHDITDDNVVATPDADGNPIPRGVIDFGDLTHGWLAADLAVCCSALLHHSGGDAFVILPAVRAFHAEHPLNEAELKALWPLVVQRACVLVASGEYQLALEPDNEYAAGNIENERTIFEVATSLPIEVMQAAILEAAGMAAAARPVPAMQRLLPDIAPPSFRTVNLDTLSPLFESGNWVDEGIERKLLQEAAAETGAAITRYGEFRLSRTRHHAATAPETHALCIEAQVPAGSRLVAPFAGVVSGENGALRIDGDHVSLLIFGIETANVEGQMIGAGAAIGRVDASGQLRVQFCRERDLTPPPFVMPHQASAWSHLCPSPSVLFGSDFDAPGLESEALLEIRQAHFARPQKNYYQQPPQIERGYREHMYAMDGRTYLDMVNNVALLGHGHEQLSAAVGRQWSFLNTNSRFHYAGIVQFTRRLADLAPEELDTVFLVNSGSEANDLALRLAWAHSGARNIISLLEAYHGWTVASDAVSTSIADNPRALSTRPGWVHAVTSPNTYRGMHRGPDSAAGYIADVEAALAAIEAKGERIGGFIAESVYGNAGGIPLPRGYLKEVYRLVRERSGVTIADEVQVGYGRLGHYFWGFEEQGVVPDIVTIAKGMGNGHPLGAVITSRAIAESLEKEGYFFSSAGGSPVSCTVGMTVLDAMRDEKLQENARAVGDHLRSRLEALRTRIPIIGAVHGMGLYLGVEFVRDSETLEPATQETAAICNRLLDLGVIMQPTGDHLNVLKIKPPLCLSRQSSDFFADMLARVLEEGW